MSDFSTTLLSEILLLPLLVDKEINVHISCRRAAKVLCFLMWIRMHARCNAQIFCNKCTYFVQKRERDNLYAGMNLYAATCIFLRDRK